MTDNTRLIEAVKKLANTKKWKTRIEDDKPNPAIVSDTLRLLDRIQENKNANRIEQIQSE